MRFEAIIFDFDGVIVDSEVVSNAALAAVLTRLGHTVSLEEAIERYCGHRWADCHRIIIEESGLDVGLSELKALADAEVERDGVAGGLAGAARLGAPFRQAPLQRRRSS